MKATRVINGFSVLFLLTPWLGGQNPDELLVIRLPAKYGHINEAGAAPKPFPTVRDEIAASGRARRCGSMAAGRSSVGCCDTSPSQAAGEVVVIVPAGRRKRGQDLLSSQNFRQSSLWRTRRDDCRNQAREPGLAKN
jgi:hypothetical protein